MWPAVVLGALVAVVSVLVGHNRGDVRVDIAFAILPGGTILGALVAGVLAGTLVTLMILLRTLDRLRWHEKVAIWEPTTQLFRSMGRDPYVPRDVIESGRFRPTGRVRVVEYPDPYPNRSTKVVKVEDLHAEGLLVAEEPVSRLARKDVLTHELVTPRAHRYAAARARERATPSCSTLAIDDDCRAGDRTTKEIVS